jgi:mRNA interferase MazF
MSDRKLPMAGDIVWVDFDPAKGSEQKGVRPAIVLTSSSFHEQSSKAIVCPITKNESPWPTKVRLPSGMKTSGHVLSDQVRVVHRAERGFRYIERAPDEVLADVRAILAALLGIVGEAA